MKVLLTKKLAEQVDGVDLRGHDAGDVFELPSAAARLLLAEQWAIADRRERKRMTLQRRRADDYPDVESRAS